MLNASYLIVIVLVLICMFTTTVALALRHVSFVRLTKELLTRARPTWMETYRRHLDDYILAFATLRMASALGLVLALAHVWDDHRAAGLLWYYLEVFVIATLVILVCGVAVPQVLAKYAGERILANVLALPVIQATRTLFRPLLAILKFFDGLIRRLVGAPPVDEEAGNEHGHEEVLHAIKEAQLHGAVDKDEKAMIESVMELDESTAAEIMTPRTDLVAIDKNASLDRVKGVIKEEGHSRIPVYDGNIDQILGLVYAKDLLYVDEDEFKLTDNLRPVSFVPEGKSLRDLLHEFQTGKSHAAIVLDEYGGTAGLVTIEDILEELVGEIVDEYERPEPSPIRRISDSVIEAESKVHVDEINELLQVRIPESDDYETIGGFVFAVLGKIPTAGEQLTYDSVKITILDAEDRRIKRLRLEVVDPSTELRTGRSSLRQGSGQA